jgi:hypothetical protein
VRRFIDVVRDPQSATPPSSSLSMNNIDFCLVSNLVGFHLLLHLRVALKALIIVIPILELCISTPLPIPLIDHASQLIDCGLADRHLEGRHRS